LKTAGLRRYKMAKYSWKTADLRRIQNGTLKDKSSKFDLPIDKTTFKYK